MGKHPPSAVANLKKNLISFLSSVPIEKQFTLGHFYFVLETLIARINTIGGHSLHSTVRQPLSSTQHSKHADIPRISSSAIFFKGLIDQKISEAVDGFNAEVESVKKNLPISQQKLQEMMENMIDESISSTAKSLYSVDAEAGRAFQVNHRDRMKRSLSSISLSLLDLNRSHAKKEASLIIQTFIAKATLPKPSKISDLNDVFFDHLKNYFKQFFMYFDSQCKDDKMCK